MSAVLTSNKRLSISDASGTVEYVCPNTLYSPKKKKKKKKKKKNLLWALEVYILLQMSSNREQEAKS